MPSRTRPIGCLCVLVLLVSLVDLVFESGFAVDTAVAGSAPYFAARAAASGFNAAMACEPTGPRTTCGVTTI